MSEVQMCDTSLDKPLSFRRSRIKEIEDFFIAEINDREEIVKTLYSYITRVDYADKIFLVLSCASSCVLLCSFTPASGTTVGIVSASIATGLEPRTT